MTSHESNSEELSRKNPEKFKSDRLDIPPVKYFWQASPLATNKYKSIPKFLRSIKVFEHFTDYEMKTFSDFIHERMFTNEEIIIKELDAVSREKIFFIFQKSLESFVRL